MLTSMSFKISRGLCRAGYQTKLKSSPKRIYSASSRSSKPGPTKNDTVIGSPPQIKIDPSKGVLHEKAAKAAQLNAELNALLDAQAQRRAEELNRGFGSGMIDFFRRSKSEMINIFAAFTCLVLAWQIVGFRKGALKILEDCKEKDSQIEELKTLLNELLSEEFCNKTAREYAKKLNEREELENNTQKSRMFGFRAKYVEYSNEKDDNELFLRNIIKRELQKVIGTSALSGFEIEEKKILDLQTELSSRPVVSEGDAPLGDLEQILGEVQVQNGDAKRTIVKSRAGFI